MIRTLTALAIAAAVATPAAAEIKLNLVGKDAATVDAMVTDAAKKVCKDELRGHPLALYFFSGCVSDVKADTMATVAKAQPTTFAERGPLAVTRISN